MGPKWNELHEQVLAILAALTFGLPELRKDAKERMLRAWYLEYAECIEDAAERCEQSSSGIRPPRMGDDPKKPH